jgi:FkbM family methyltransferase
MGSNGFGGSGNGRPHPKGRGARLASRLLRHVGYRIAYNGWGKRWLRSYGFTAKTIIDVGVASGTPSLYSAFPDASLFLIEPVSEFEDAMHRILRTRSGAYVIAAAGEEDSSITLNVEAKPEMSSSLPRTPLTITGSVIEERVVPVRRIDSIVRQYKLEGPFGIKIDVEGAELSVLTGAPETLGRTQFLIIELSLSPRFHGGPTASTVIAKLAEGGLLLRDVLQVVGGPEGGRFIDALFVRTEQPIN